MPWPRGLGLWKNEHEKLCYDESDMATQMVGVELLIDFPMIRKPFVMDSTRCLERIIHDNVIFDVTSATWEFRLR